LSKCGFIAFGVCSELGEKGGELLWAEEVQHLTKLTLIWTRIAWNEKVASVFPAFVQGEKALCATHGVVRREAVDGE
jgi:hypothetical protein